MKKSLLCIIVFATALVCQSRADLFNLTFTQTEGPTTAIGQIDVVGGLAISGYLNVTGGLGVGTYTLVAPGSDGSFVWDNAVAPDANPFIPGSGLLWRTGGFEFNLFYNFTSQWAPIGTYSLWGNIDGNWHPAANGTATLTSVPDGGATVALLGAALLGFALLRRRFLS
jgi:hypothetical protein